jgi:hypothetical protein
MRCRFAAFALISDAAFRRHDQKDDAADESQRAHNGRNGKRLVLLGGRLERTDINDGFLLSPSETAEQDRHQPDYYE